MVPKKQFMDFAYERIGSKLWDTHGRFVGGFYNATLNRMLVKPMLKRLKVGTKPYILKVGLKHNDI